MDIIATISPFLNDPLYKRFVSAVNRIVKSGINTIRINLKMTDSNTIKLIDDGLAIIRKEWPNLDIILDLPCPYRKTRTILQGYKVPYQIQKDEEALLKLMDGSKTNIPCILFDGEHLPTTNDILTYSDGQGEFIVTKIISPGEAIIRAKSSFSLYNYKALSYNGKNQLVFNLQNIDLINTLQKKHNISRFYVSFISSLADLDLCYSLLHIPPQKIIPKIETIAAIRNLPSVVSGLSESVVLARGDLALSLPMKQFGYVCEHISSYINDRNKKLIVATDILSSLLERSYPSRADIIDLHTIIHGYRANSIILSTSTILSHNFERSIEILSAFY